MMNKFGSDALRRRPALRTGARSLVLAAAALAVGAVPAGAHGGDTTLVHSCIGGDGNVKIVAADEACKKGELPLDWSRDGAGTTYTAGSGLSLSAANEFSVTGAPWSGLTGVPSGFADGVDDVGASIDMKSNDASAPREPNDNDGFVHWNNLEGVPSDIADGDDDGAAAINQLKGDLSQDDGTPNQTGDPVSFSKIKDLTTMSGDGRITGSFVRDGSIESQDIGDGTIAARDLAGSDAPGATVVGAVTSEKILDGTIHARDLAAGVLNTIVTTTTTVGPQEIPPGERAAVEVPLAGVDPSHLVVVSPPAALDAGLVFAGSDVLAPGTVTIYLHNITAGPVQLGNQPWTIRQLRNGG